MKRNVFTKTFNNSEELNSFINSYVGERKYWQIRPQSINVEGLTMTVVMTTTKCFFDRKRICEENGFEYERKDV